MSRGGGRCSMPPVRPSSDVAAFRRLWPGNVVLKGIMHPDAALGLNHVCAQWCGILRNARRWPDRRLPLGSPRPRCLQLPTLAPSSSLFRFSHSRKTPGEPRDTDTSAYRKFEK